MGSVWARVEQKNIAWGRGLPSHRLFIKTERETQVRLSPFFWFLALFGPTLLRINMTSSLLLQLFDLLFELPIFSFKTLNPLIHTQDSIACFSANSEPIGTRITAFPNQLLPPIQVRFPHFAPTPDAYF